MGRRFLLRLRGFFLVRESVLYGQRFDPDTIKLSGEPIPVASDVSTSPYTGLRFTASSHELRGR
jgi:hypothetical protein